jgi:hypothetical protein
MVCNCLSKMLGTVPFLKPTVYLLKGQIYLTGLCFSFSEAKFLTNIIIESINKILFNNPVY